MYTLGMPSRVRLPRRGKFIANDQLRALRVERGLSQERLAELADPPCSQPDIQRLESGNAHTTAEWAVRLARPLGVEPQALFPGLPLLSDRSGIDPDLVARAVALARRVESESDAIASEIISAAYALLALGIPIDSEAAVAVLEIFARRLRRLLS
jgi:transcriptional regulator with XRE-family HTH domain